MEWDSIYKELSKEMFMGVKISNPVTIKKIKQINEQNRILFIKYHNEEVKKAKHLDTIQPYKYKRKLFLQFLSNEAINKISLKEISQEHLKSYFAPYYEKDIKENFENIVAIIREAFACIKDSVNLNISFELSDIVTLRGTQSRMPIPDWSTYCPSLIEASSE